MAQVAALPLVKTFPVIEVFGPTIQGEGALAGLPTYFVRFGGCDYRCSWCDSMYAVEPSLVRENARKVTAQEIVTEVAALPGGARWVTLSGGNPALLELEPLVRLLHGLRDYRVAVETQGSRWRPWLGMVNCLTVSPKPPSSGMVNDKNDRQTQAFMEQATEATLKRWALVERSVRALKIVVFDQDDLDWAAAFFNRWPQWPGYLSVGTNPIGSWGSDVTSAISDRAVRDQIADRYRWLCEQAVSRPELADVRVLPQLHVLAWAHSRGV
jgi:7-carboxy-7-deazaguanine synthase